MSILISMKKSATRCRVSELPGDTPLPNFVLDTSAGKH